MGIIEGARQRAQSPTAEGVPAGYGVNWARVRYDFAVEGGAIGTIDLATDTIPANSVILGGFVDVITPPGSAASGTLGIGVESGADIVAAAAVSGAPWSTTGRKAVIPAWTGPTSVRTTAARTIKAIIATGALNAGQVDVYLAYLTVA